MFEKTLKYSVLKDAAARLEESRGRVSLSGVWGSAPALIAAALGRLCDAPVLFVVKHPDDSDDAADDIEIFLGQSSGSGGAYQFPAWENQLATDHVSAEVTGQRLRLLNMLLSGSEEVEYMVAPVMALLQPVPAPEALRAGRAELKKGIDRPMEDLLEWLVDSGYDPVEQVDRQGEFAHRGGIVDIFPPGEQLAVRVEYFGDVIESVRRFDLDTQRSTEHIESCEIPSLVTGGRTCSLLEYLPGDTIVCMVEPDDIRQLGAEIYGRVRDDLASGDSPVAMRGVEEIFGAMERLRRVDMHHFRGGDVRLGVRSLEGLSINTAEALRELEALARETEVWVCCANIGEQERFERVIAEQYPALAANVKIASGHVTGGFHWPDPGIVVVGHHEIYRRYTRIRRVRRIRTGRPIQSMVDLVEGDYVVHLGHGIARFEGLRRLEREGISEEYLKLKFRDNAVLHVPASRIDLVQKYIGSKGYRPSLSSLGGRMWAAARKRVGEAVKDMAAELLRIQAARRSSPGRSFPSSTTMQAQFADEFPYTETPDQLEAIGQIDADTAAPRPMDRLVCGDVGYGKTELAMRAALKAAEEGAQTAVLVPTTLLAEQHYRTFSERFADYPVIVEMLCRLRTAGQQGKIIEKLKCGQVDVIIGTHRLLSGDVEFADLGLVVIDEEQRFGVAAKEHLKSLRTSVDVLTLTATPIPRTVHMALLGLRDISSLQTPPMDRRAIYTEVVTGDQSLIRAAIMRELNRGGQVFFLHNRIRGIERAADRIRSLARGAVVDIAHGRMGRAELEDVMMRFVSREIDVLVTTTIIESGLDIPSANTMIIHDADRFGLSELHQLRGRVGRYIHRAYCYLLLPETRTVSPSAARRLKAIEDFSDLGAGFQIAMRDLEIRGAGNILGREQSGHISAVGYELYCRLLAEAAGALRGQAPPRRIEVHVEFGVEAYIPRSYVPSDRQRMELYRRLAACSAASEIGSLRDDIIDACGPVPVQAALLLDVMELRIRLSEIDVDRAVLMEPDVVFRGRDPEKIRGALSAAAGTVRLTGEGQVYWRPPEDSMEPETVMGMLLGYLRRT